MRYVARLFTNFSVVQMRRRPRVREIRREKSAPNFDGVIASLSNIEKSSFSLSKEKKMEQTRARRLESFFGWKLRNSQSRANKSSGRVRSSPIEKSNRRKKKKKKKSWWWWLGTFVKCDGETMMAREKRKNNLNYMFGNSLTHSIGLFTSSASSCFLSLSRGHAAATDDRSLQ